MKKRIVSLVMAIAMCLSLSVTAFAAEAKDFSPSKVEFEDIPIFITYMESNNSDIISSANEAISLLNNNISDHQEPSRITSPSYEVVEISNDIKTSLLSNHLFASTFKRVTEMISNGIKVNYLNFYLPANAKSMTTDTDTISYWENICDYYAIYEGYKFLSLPSSVGVESSWVTPDNIDPYDTWSEIATSYIKTFVDCLIENYYYDVLESVVGSLRDFFDLANSTPLTVSYGTAQQSYIKAKVSGTAYIKTIFIRDDLDKVDGYAYYDWGTVEAFKSTLKIDCKWPTERTSYGYEYDTETRNLGSTKTCETPGYSSMGKYDACDRIIDLYENNIGRVYYQEEIDIYSLIAEMVSSVND